MRVILWIIRLASRNVSDHTSDVLFCWFNYKYMRLLFTWLLYKSIIPVKVKVTRITFCQLMCIHITFSRCRLLGRHAVKHFSGTRYVRPQRGSSEGLFPDREKFGFEVLTAFIFWDIAACSLYTNQHFGGIRRLHFHGRKSAEQETIVLAGR
jgi:hypothetical protein